VARLTVQRVWSEHRKKKKGTVTLRVSYLAIKRVARGREESVLLRIGQKKGGRETRFEKNIYKLDSYRTGRGRGGARGRKKKGRSERGRDHAE